MKEKHQKLLKRLDRPEFQTGETLADFMAVSSKTIQLMIREINEELEGAVIVSCWRWLKNTTGLQIRSLWICSCDIAAYCLNGLERG